MERGFVCHVNERIPGAIYIGRANGRSGLSASKFYNPYVIGMEHDSLPRGETLTRLKVVPMYHKYLMERPFLLRQLPDLRGKPLACWCRRSTEGMQAATNWCHGDVILFILANWTDEELRSMT